MAVPLMFQPLVKYAQFEGRSRRSEFWLWILFRIILGQLLGAVAMAIIGPVFAQIGTHPEAFQGHPEMFFQTYMQSWFRILPFFSVISLALLIPSLAVTVRRLHDINRSGWWVVLPWAATILGFILFFIVCGATFVSAAAGHAGGHASPADGARVALQIVGSMFLCVFLPVLISGIVMLVFFVTEGTRGANRFGPDPKGHAPTEVF